MHTVVLKLGLWNGESNFLLASSRFVVLPHGNAAGNPQKTPLLQCLSL